MRILIVVPEQDHISGNWVSARRFQHGLQDHRHQVLILGVTLNGGAGFRQKVVDFAPDVALLLHAYRSGKPWLTNMQGLEIPFVIMMTGTDINLGLEDREQRSVIVESIHKAAFVMLQNPLLAEHLLAQHPDLGFKVRTIKPGITLGESPFHLREDHNLDKETPLFLCPAGIRPVKMQRELLVIFDEVTADQPVLQLIFCGPCLDENYSRAFLEDVSTRPWAHYLGSLSPDVMASVMRESDVIVNNSLAEGLSNSLVEAATLGIPILARNNLGNAAVVNQNVNGLLYSRPEECNEMIMLLLDPHYRRKLSCPDENYSLKEEISDLEAVLSEAVL